MSSQDQITPAEFVAIAGDCTLEDADKYLKMAKHNLEMALNYYFNKKDKVIKPSQSQQQPMTLLQKLQDGSRKQSHVEKIVKDLTNEVSKSKRTSTEAPKKSSPNKPTTTKYTSSVISNPSSARSQRGSSNSNINSIYSSQGSKTTPKANNEIKKADSTEKISNFFGSWTKENSSKLKPVTPSTEGPKDSVEKRDEDVFMLYKGTTERPEEKNFGSLEALEKHAEEEDEEMGDKESVQKHEDSVHALSRDIIEELNENNITLGDSQQSIFKSLYGPNAYLGSENNQFMENLKYTNKQPPILLEQQQENTMLGAIDIEQSNTGGMNEAANASETPNVKKSFKRSYSQFAKPMEMENNSLSGTRLSQDLMGVTDSEQDGTWPRLLGTVNIKALVAASVKVNAQQGDPIQLKLEKLVVNNEKKKGGRSKAATAPPIAIIRVLHQDQEVGKLEASCSQIFALLLAREYIELQATLGLFSDTWKTFAPFYLDVKVYLNSKAISKPLTKVYSSQDNLSVEEESLLNELQHTQTAFTALFDLLSLKQVTGTLVGRPNINTAAPPLKHSRSLGSTNTKSQASQSFETLKPAGDKQMVAEYADPSQAKDKEAQDKEDQLRSIESELYKELLDAKETDYDELQPPDFLYALNLGLSPEEMIIMTWMLLREGSDDKQRDLLYKNGRVLHPLWEEYLLADKTSLYFNPFTGQVCIQVPKSVNDCSGGIMVNMSLVAKAEMVSTLVICNNFEKDKASGYDKVTVKKKNLTFVHGKNTMSNIMKGPLLPAKTLLIVPLDALFQWEGELSRISQDNDTIKVLVYHGNKRAQERRDISSYDIVLTTYGVVSGEFSSDGKKELFNYEWFRVILDKAHYIKGKRIQTTKAIEDLNILHRWCFANFTTESKVDDLFNMLNYLKIEPWSCHTWWNAHIGKPLERNDKGAIQIIKTILNPVMLVSASEGEIGDREGELNRVMPETMNRVIWVNLLKEEKDYYTCLFKKTKDEFDKLIAQDALMDNYAYAFDLVVRMRQSCSHLFLIYSKFEVQDNDSLEVEISEFLGKKDSEEDSKKENDDLSIDDIKSLKNKNHDHFEIIIDDKSRNEQVIAIQKPEALVDAQIIHETVERLNAGDIVHCPLCLNDLENAIVTLCGHILCSLCAKRNIEAKSICPVCSSMLTRKDCLFISRKVLFSISIEERYRRSSKFDSIAYCIKDSIMTGRKCVFVSQFSAMVLLLEYELTANELNYMRIDGIMPDEEKYSTIRDFNSNNDINILLSSLVLGDTRKEIIEADVVYITEPSSEERLEEEFLLNIRSRVPENKLEVVRFVCKETVEETIMDLRERKRENPDRKVPSTPDERILEGLEDLCYLIKQPS